MPSVNNRIAILTLSVGAGHVRAAEVIERALSDGENNLDVQTIDALSLARRGFVWAYVNTYWLMLQRAPWLWRWLFETRQKKRHTSTAPHWFFRWGCVEVLRTLRAMEPKLVVVNEIGAAEIAALGKRESWFSCPILAVQTDYQTEPPWVQEEIDAYCVGSEEARAQLLGWGISPNRVFVCGIPIDPTFALSFDKRELMQSLGLDAHRPTVLVMGGGMGPVPLHEVVESLNRCGLPLQVIAVAGHNQGTRRHLESLRGKLAMDLRILGWSENIPELMAAADLLITKPGGVTSAEALAAGIPMLLTHPIPGPEERHVMYLEREGVAVYAKRLDQIPTLAHRLLCEPARLEEMRGRARAVSRPGAAYAVAQVARALLDQATYIDLLANPSPRPSDSAFVM
ncbi:MAG TPA: glycosyltransferase [Terriglobia bacterium]|jgi:processive 1,2-diacylglycerol beta-glucosyltransferase|nr:glycosyltransferase [Terriglobia bacterium]